MASIRKKNGVYQIRFSRKLENGTRQQKQLTLGTGIKREAEKLLLEFEDQFNRGEIDPFNGWTPLKEAENKRRSMRGKNLPLHEAADLFIEERTQANKTSKNNYRRHFNMLMDLMGRTMPVTEIHEKDIRDFCFRSDLQPATQASYLRHYKVFFRWMHEKDILKVDITKGIKAPKIPQKISQKTLSRDDLQKVFDAFDTFNKEQISKGFITKDHQKRYWFKPMINTIYYCGLRAKESVNLTWANVDLEEGYIRIVSSDSSNTKSGKDRTLPIRKELLPVLKQWHDERGKPEEGYVFPSATGSTEWHKMDTAPLSRSFKKFVRLAKLPESINLHGLRHSCATDLLRKGAPINQVSKFLGHSSVEVTQIYEHLDETDLKRTLDGIE